eukprot:768628-Hanusia_phi.AAC.1
MVWTCCPGVLYPYLPLGQSGAGECLPCSLLAHDDVGRQSFFLGLYTEYLVQGNCKARRCWVEAPSRVWCITRDCLCSVLLLPGRKLRLPAAHRKGGGQDRYAKACTCALGYLESLDGRNKGHSQARAAALLLVPDCHVAISQLLPHMVTILKRFPCSDLQFSLCYVGMRTLGPETLAFSAMVTVNRWFRKLRGRAAAGEGELVDSVS